MKKIEFVSNFTLRADGSYTTRRHTVTTKVDIDTYFDILLGRSGDIGYKAGRITPGTKHHYDKKRGVRVVEGCTRYLN